MGCTQFVLGYKTQRLLNVQNKPLPCYSHVGITGSHPTQEIHLASQLHRLAKSFGFDWWAQCKKRKPFISVVALWLYANTKVKEKQTSVFNVWNNVLTL